MAERLDEIAPAVPLRLLRRLRGDRCVIEVEQFPEAQRATHVEGKGKAMFRRLARHRRQAAQIGHQIANILGLRMGIGGVGEGRIVVPPVRRHARLHGVDEIGYFPAADAVLRIRRDVGHEKTAEGRFQLKPASKPEAIILPDALVAGGAAPCIEDHATALLIPPLLERQGAGRDNRRRRTQEQCGRSPQHRQHDERNDQLAHGHVLRERKWTGRISPRLTSVG